MAAPVPLIVETSRLLGDTNGKPYLFKRSSSSKFMNWLRNKYPHGRESNGTMCNSKGQLFNALNHFKKSERKFYQAESKQLSRVMTYGTPENCSVDLFFMILLKVILHFKLKKTKNREKQKIT
ncbi:AGC (cAMP-dependent [Striga asiatica]|uniref:AGC (cAMP-dependent) n=1 Tax=Striga asiatica TaxID=4170 RepID=A0A5A7QR71_STRAF|nr:AGC (cAMP-dependent [Striga asiatica]